ncbi:hypothetical protein BS47DRAFT_1377777 [Hydnum rufescens UP504]|uniref:MATE efflux family protein n=1 Tax=Hydnum rufescens UP504 TaxID=1448309 RepID=A0A9P6DMN7_9AGAM|nr:hypothetical protein BS47DRAFT_1377777 [Hydnum rufescens UP504]
MSSTYMHYNSGPASLPNDYAILSQYLSSQRPSDSGLESTGDEDLPETEDEAEHEVNCLSGEAVGSGVRKASFGGHSMRSPHWKAPEQEPLLADIPRIDEDWDVVSQDGADTWALWIQEGSIIARYTLPVFGTHLLEYSLSMVSVISIGHLGTTQLAAATLGSMTSSVTGLSIILGFVSALDSLLPQAWTTNPSLVGLWSQRMTLLMIITLIPIFLTWFNAEYILIFLHQDPEIAHLAGIYLRWLSIGLPAYAFNAVARRYLQSQGLLHVPTAIVLIVAPLMCSSTGSLVCSFFITLRFILKFSISMGTGWGATWLHRSPLATGLSFNLIALCTLIYAVAFAPRVAWHPIGRASFKNLGILVQLGLASVGQLASEWWSWELVGLAASFLGPASLATQSVLLVTCSTSYQAPYALSVAASVRIGNLLGAGHASRAKAATSVALLFSLGLGLFFSIILLTFRAKWGYIFNDDPEVISLVAHILPLCSVFQIFDGLCSVTAGVMRSRGRQSIGALLNFSAYYIIGIPLGLVLTFRFGMELYGLWIGLAAALLYGAIFSVWLVLRTDWDREVQRVAARLAADNKCQVVA